MLIILVVIIIIISFISTTLGILSTKNDRYTYSLISAFLNMLNFIVSCVTMASFHYWPVTVPLACAYNLLTLFSAFPYAKDCYKIQLWTYRTPRHTDINNNLDHNFDNPKRVISSTRFKRSILVVLCFIGYLIAITLFVLTLILELNNRDNVNIHYFNKYNFCLNKLV